MSVCHAHQRNQLFRVALSNGLCREYEYNFEYCAMFAVMNTSKAEVKILIQACMGFESMAFAIPVQCSAN